MKDNKRKKQKSEDKTEEYKKNINPGHIKGKIDVRDTRERRDGPGGN